MTFVRNKRIALKDGSALSENTADVRRVGAIVRYRRGSTALMRIDKVEEDAHGFRIEGMNIVGDSHSAYAHDCLPASTTDLATWTSYLGVRRGSYLSDRRE